MQTAESGQSVSGVGTSAPGLTSAAVIVAAAAVVAAAAAAHVIAAAEEDDEDQDDPERIVVGAEHKNNPFSAQVVLPDCPLRAAAGGQGVHRKADGSGAAPDSAFASIL